MKLKLLKKITAGIVAGLLAVTVTTTTASASNLFATIYNAGRACSSAQMEMQRIADRMNAKYTTTSTGVVEPVIVEPQITTGSFKPTTINVRPQLSTFGVYSYIEHGTVHNDYGETVHRSNLPLYVLLYEEGYGNIIGVTIDGVGLDSALVTDRLEFDDGTPIDEACMQLVIFDDSVIQKLSNGEHNVVIFAANENGQKFCDNFTFVLAD